MGSAAFVADPTEDPFYARTKSVCVCIKMIISVRNELMKYICFFDSKTNNRPVNIAAVNKIKYICSVFNDVGTDIKIISCAMSAPEKSAATEEQLFSHTTVKYFKTNRIRHNPFWSLKEVIRRSLIVFFYLLFNTKKNEKVIVYHSLAIMRGVMLAHKLRGFHLLLETEEIYNDVYVRSKRNQKTERKFLESADSYFFPTEVLANKVNTRHKPQAIIYGAYEVKLLRSEPFSDGRKHIAYTGSFDPNKGGLFTAIEVARYLDDSYCLHILGHGTPDATKRLNDFIEEHSGKDACEIVYDGLLNGDDYIRYLRRCDVGLSTQNPYAAFNTTSFPSKVISYLANNLRVVTFPIQVLKESEMDRLLYYYDSDSPEEIAKVIKGIDYHEPYDSQSLILALAEEFRRRISTL